MNEKPVSIPDDDVPGWLETLREGGFSESEIDSIMSHLNETYAGVKMNEAVEKELRKMDAEITNRRGTPLTDEEKKSLRAGIESRFK